MYVDLRQRLMLEEVGMATSSPKPEPNYDPFRIDAFPPREAE
jgi:hypothetical protein